MNHKSRAFAVTASLLAASFVAGPSVAQKQSGILKIYMLDSPASMSIHEEATVVAERPVMGVFNNLVMFDQHVQQNSLGSIIPDYTPATRARLKSTPAELTAVGHD